MRKILSALIFLAFGAAAWCQTPPPHPSVTLTWTLSIDDTAANCAAPNVCVQNVYRISGACSGTFALPAGTSPIAAGISPTITSYTDTSVSIGQRFCYATTFSVNGIESAFSNSSNVVILPSPQTNVRYNQA